MNIKYKFSIGISIFLNVVLLASLYYLLNLRKQPSEISNKELAQENVINNLINSFSKSFKFNNHDLKCSTILSDSLKKSILTKKFVLRFSEFACITCIDDALNQIKELKPDVKDSNILIISSFSESRGFNIFKNKFKSDYTFINESVDFLIEGELKNVLQPHFFILNNELKINNFYIYQENIPKLNKHFFNKIKTEFKY